MTDTCVVLPFGLSAVSARAPANALAGAERAGGGRVDLVAPRRRVGLAHERRGRLRDERRIGDVRRAVGEGDLLRLGDEVVGERGGLPGRGQVDALEDVEHLLDGDAARGRRREAEDDAPAVGAGDRRPPHRPVGGEVLQREDPRVLRHGARGPHVADDPPRDRALVERVGAAAHDPPQGGGEVGLAEDRARPDRLSAGQEERRARREAREPVGLARGRALHRQRHADAEARELLGGRDRLGQRERAVALQRRLHAGHDAGHADGQVAGEVPVQPGPGEGRRRGGRAGRLAEVQRADLAGAAAVEHEAAAADAARLRPRRAERERGGHRRVDGVAARLEHRAPDARRRRRLRGDHPEARADRLVEPRSLPGLCADRDEQQDGRQEDEQEAPHGRIPTLSHASGTPAGCPRTIRLAGLMPRARGWRPRILRTSGSVTEAVYGLILATSVIAVSREYEPTNAGLVGVTVLVTGVVFWLAHVYAGVLALSVTHHRRPRGSDAGDLLRREWPLVEVTVPLLLILAAGALDVVPDNAAIVTAMLVAVTELALAGGYAARKAGAGLTGTVVSAAVAASLGGAVVLLKVLVH
jgi:hypothetical protein